MSLVGQIAELQNYATYKELSWEGGFEEYLALVRRSPQVTRNAYGAIPPLAVRVAKYSQPTVPSGSVIGASTMTVLPQGVMSIVCSAVPGQPLASVAVTVNVDDPPAAGVPEIKPAGESVKPAGSAPELRTKL